MKVLSLTTLLAAGMIMGPLTLAQAASVGAHTASGQPHFAVKVVHDDSAADDRGKVEDSKETKDSRDSQTEIEDGN